MNRTRIAALITTCAVALCLSMPVQAYQPASATWQTFIDKSELVVWVKLVKWELVNGSDNRYTFQVQKTYRGPKDKQIVLQIPLSPRNSIGPVGLASEGFLFLRKDGKQWKTAMDGRSWWPHLYAMTPKISTLIHVAVGDFIHELPPELIKLRHKQDLAKILVDRKQHNFKADIYLRDAVDKFLTTVLK